MSESSNPAVFGAGARRSVAAAAVVAGVAAVWIAGPQVAGPEATDRYILAHALVALVCLAVGIAATAHVVRLGPAEYREFWRRWLVASCTSTLAGIAAVLAVVTEVEAFLLVDMALLVAALPIWVSATILMARAQAGRRSVSVDLFDAVSALLVLGAPGVLLVAEPLVHAEQPAFAVPFVTVAITAPASVYLSFVNLFRIPRGERAAQGIGAVCAAVTGGNLTLQVARVLGGLTLPLRVFVAVHVLNMGLMMVIPVWAHRRPTGRLALLPEHRQVRQIDTMPYVGAVALPLMGLYVFLTRHERPWGVWFFLVVVLAVVSLNAVRYAAMSRETRRLYAGIARMAEERRQLLDRLLRGLEDDRHRTAAELHSQVVGSLATLSTVAQMAHVALPGETGLTVTETVEQLQGDLTERAEHLRQLMLAVRPAAFDHDALTAALLAYASQLGQEGAPPAIRVDADPGLRLDSSTMTIVYRIAQEAVRNAVRHAGDATIGVQIAEHAGRVVVEVCDDGAGFDPATVTRGSGLTTMELFAHLGGGRLVVRSAPGQGTSVRAVLGGWVEVEDAIDRPAPRRHLRAVLE